MKPNLIFIIGPSCSGKSSMSQNICRLHPEYSVLDDVAPLYKIFNADNLLYQKKLKDFWDFVKKINLIFITILKILALTVTLIHKVVFQLISP